MKKSRKTVINNLSMLFLLSKALLIGNSAYCQISTSDNTSQVPKYIFPFTMEEQLESLKTNPLMLRLNESRKRMAGDKYRPVYHYVNPEGRLNDPNGLCYWDGYWHLFYQAYPPEDPRQHWGHAISKDLVHWEDLPYAIYPNPERAVYSGSTLVEKDRVIAMYHGTLAGNMVAVSSDPLLLNWEKVSGKAVIPIRSTSGFSLPYSVFDPCIWKEDTVYYALSGGRENIGPGDRPVPVVYLFRSLDLENWEYLHPFIEKDIFTEIGDDYACPYFLPIGNRYIMPFFSHMSGGQYLLGDYDKNRNKFLVSSHGKFNFGSASPSGVHAPSATHDGNGNVIIIFNMNPGFSTQGWNQIMTLPRRLTLVSENELKIEPAGDLSSLRYNFQNVKSMHLAANEELVFKNIRGNTMEIYTEIDMKDSQMIELNVLRSQNKEEFTRIVFYKEKGFHTGLEYIAGSGTALMPADLVTRLTGITSGSQTPRTTQSLISLETSYSSTIQGVRFRPPETAPVLLKPGETLKLRIFIDKSVVEVYVNDRQCIAARVYPGRNDSLGVSVRSQGYDAELLSFEAWQISSIYD